MNCTTQEQPIEERMEPRKKKQNTLSGQVATREPLLELFLCNYVIYVNVLEHRNKNRRCLATHGLTKQHTAHTSTTRVSELTG
jgi:hypothetical protein